MTLYEQRVNVMSHCGQAEGAINCACSGLCKCWDANLLSKRSDDRNATHRELQFLLDGMIDLPSPRRRILK